MQSVTKGAIQRLARKAGIKRLSGLLYEESRGIIQVYIQPIVRDAVLAANNKKRIRVQVNDVQIALRSRGRTPYSRPCTQVKHQDTGHVAKSCGRKPETACAVRIAPQITRRRKPGVKALQDVRAYQKQRPCFSIAKEAFRRIVYQMSADHQTESQWSPEALDILQTDMESYMIDTFKAAQLTAIHGKRVTVQPKDMQLARRLDGAN